MFGSTPKLPGLVGDLVSTLGITMPLAPLTGMVPAASLGTLAGGASGSTKPSELDLTLHLPPIQPKGLEAILGSDPLGLTIKSDKGRLVAGGETTLQLTPPTGGPVKVKASLSADPTPAEGGAFYRLAGAVTPPTAVLPPLPLHNLTVDQLALELALVKQADRRVPRVGLQGSGKLGQSPLTIQATLGQTADRRADVTLSITTALKLADLLAHPVPGLDAVMLEKVSVGRDQVGGTVRLGSGAGAKELTALVYTPAGKSKPNLALGHPSLALSDLVPPLKGTPLDDLALANGALVVVHPDNDAKGIPASSLPPALVTMLGGPQADPLQRAGGVDLPAGVSVMASLDVSRSKPLHALLDAVGVGTTARLPLHGRLDRELFTHTPWGGRAGAAKLTGAFMDNLDVAVPLPALKMPGDAKALTLKPGALAVRGKGGLWLGIETGGDVALPDRTLTVAPLKLALAKGSTTTVTLDGTIPPSARPTRAATRNSSWPSRASR